MNSLSTMKDAYSKIRELFISNYSKIIIILFSYWFSLRYFFPGYFNPLIPHHSDIFDYYKDSASLNLIDFLKSSRMTGDFLVSLSGNINYKMTIIFAIAISILNIFLLVNTYEKVFKVRNGALSTLLYCILVFSHIGFYINYTFDIYSTLSFTFLVLIINVWYSEHRKLNVKYFGLITLLVFLCVTTKETYIVPVFCFMFFQFVLAKTRENRKYIFELFCLSIVVVIFSLLRSKLFGSSFVSLGNNVNDPYYTSFDIKSIIRIFIYYIRGAVNIYFIFAVIMVLAISLLKKKSFLEHLMFLCMGASAYAPYTILPNHVVPHYYWVGVPLLFLVYFPLNNLPNDITGKRLKPILTAILCIFYVLSIYSNFQNYSSVKWAIQPEIFNKNIIRSFSYIKNKINPSEKILISGLQNSTENPFRSEHVIKDSFDINTNFYLGTLGEEDYSSYIKKVNISKFDVGSFDRILVYDSQGILVRDIHKDEISKLKVSSDDLTTALYPEIEKNILEQKAKPDDWYTNMNLANSYVNINKYEKAHYYMDLAVSLCKDSNPYPSFFMGQLLESENKYDEALLSYKKAYNIDSDNVYFKDAIARVEKLLKK